LEKLEGINKNGKINRSFHFTNNDTAEENQCYLKNNKQSKPKRSEKNYLKTVKCLVVKNILIFGLDRK